MGGGGGRDNAQTQHMGGGGNVWPHYARVCVCVEGGVGVGVGGAMYGPMQYIEVGDNVWSLYMEGGDNEWLHHIGGVVSVHVVSLG